MCRLEGFGPRRWRRGPGWLGVPIEGNTVSHPGDCLMAPRRNPAQPNQAGDGGPEAVPNASSDRKRGAARKPGPSAAADPGAVTTAQPVRPAGPTLEQRLRLLEQALGEIGK